MNEPASVTNAACFSRTSDEDEDVEAKESVNYLKLCQRDAPQRLSTKPARKSLNARRVFNSVS